MSEPSLSFICKVIRRIIAAAKTYPRKLSRVIKTSPAVEVLHVEIKRDEPPIPCHLSSQPRACGG